MLKYCIFVCRLSWLRVPLKELLYASRKTEFADKAGNEPDI